MRKTFTDNFVTPNIFVIFLLFLCYAGAWIFASFAGSTTNTVNIEHFSPLAVTLQSIFAQNELIPNILSFFICLLNAFLLLLFNNRFSLVRARTSLPVIIFLLLTCGAFNSYTLFSCHLALTLFIVALFLFFEMYHNKAVEKAFMGSFLTTCASLIIPQYIFIIVVFWIALLSYKAFSARTFLASIFGVLTPIILYFSCLYLIDGSVDFYQYMMCFIPREIGFNSDFSLIDIIYQSIMLLFFIICTITVYHDINKDIVRTRKNLNFCFIILLCSIVIRLGYAESFEPLMPLTLLGYTIFFSHTFTLKQTKFQQIVFILFCLINILFVFL